MLSRVLEYFDLAPQMRMRGAGQTASQARVLPQYVALLAGIIVQPFFSEYQATGRWDLSGFWAWSAGAAIIGICIFPSVYKSTLDANRPIPVQFCLIFTAGMGWQSLFQTAIKAGSQAAQ